MLSSEAGTQRTLLKWIVNLKCSEIKKKQSMQPSNYSTELQTTAYTKFITYCNVPVEEILERQTQASNHFSQKQCIDAPFKH